MPTSLFGSWIFFHSNFNIQYYRSREKKWWWWRHFYSQTTEFTGQKNKLKHSNTHTHTHREYRILNDLISLHEMIMGIRREKNKQTRTQESFHSLYILLLPLKMTNWMMIDDWERKKKERRDTLTLQTKIKNCISFFYLSLVGTFIYLCITFGSSTTTTMTTKTKKLKILEYKTKMKWPTKW